MLDTGFDCPEVVNLVMARFTKSAVLYRQMRGRGTRKAPHIRKSDFTMFDFVGVTDFHGDDDGEIPGDVIREPGQPPYGPATPRTLLTLDVDDHIDRAWAEHDEGANWTEKWWFADAVAIQAAEFNLSAGRYRPQNRARVEHRDPLEILGELRGIEREIQEEIEALEDEVREAVSE